MKTHVIYEVLWKNNKQFINIQNDETLWFIVSIYEDVLREPYMMTTKVLDILNYCLELCIKYFILFFSVLFV